MADKEKKKPNGEGSLRERDDGRFEMRITVVGKNGAPKSKSFYGKTESEARKKCKQYLNELNNGIDPDAKYTVHEWSDIWFQHHKGSISFATQDQYRNLLRNHIIPYLGHRKIADVSPFDIERFQMHMHENGYATQTIRTCRGIISKMFKVAQANKLVSSNPVSLSENLRIPNDTPELEDEDDCHKSFTDEELLILMKQLPMDKFGLGIRLMLCTGMRVQELLALEPECISEDGSVIHVRQAVGRVKGTVRIKGTKSKNSVRKIPVPKSCRWIAKELRKSDTKFIFEMRKNGTPCNPSTFNNRYRKALEAIPEVPYLSPHHCRHTYISLMHESKADFETLRSIAGHFDTKMTRHYLEVQDRSFQEAVANFDRFFDQCDPVNDPKEQCKVLEFPTFKTV